MTKTKRPSRRLGCLVMFGFLALALVLPPKVKWTLTSVISIGDDDERWCLCGFEEIQYRAPLASPPTHRTGSQASIAILYDADGIIKVVKTIGNRPSLAPPYPAKTVIVYNTATRTLFCRESAEEKPYRMDLVKGGWVRHNSGVMSAGDHTLVKATFIRPARLLIGREARLPGLDGALSLQLVKGLDAEGIRVILKYDGGKQDSWEKECFRWYAKSHRQWSDMASPFLD